MSDIAAEVVRRAESCRLILVTAESCTAGALAQILSKAPGAGKILQGGFVTCTKDMKTRVLGVSASLLQAKTVVCAEVCEAMARAHWTLPVPHLQPQSPALRGLNLTKTATRLA